IVKPAPPETASGSGNAQLQPSPLPPLAGSSRMAGSWYGPEASSCATEVSSAAAGQPFWTGVVAATAAGARSISPAADATAKDRRLRMSDSSYFDLVGLLSIEPSISTTR